MEAIYIPDYVQKIIDTLNQNGFQAYLVGGCVRDALLNRIPNDYDVATNALPDQVESLFEKTIPTGKKHGTISVMMDHHIVEVTTFRKEEEYKDHRHPQKVDFINEIDEDLARRDFTINAMAYHPKTGLIDPYNGQEDLKNKMIKTVGDPNKRFQEDALRMMRAFRFAAKLDFNLDENTKNAVASNKSLLKDVSAERIVPELSEILQYDPHIIVDMADLLEDWIPQIKESLNTTQYSKWHYTDVLRHILDAVAYANHPFNFQVAWALLLHDLGKPVSHTSDDKGIDHFKKHPVEGYKIARKILKMLKFSKKDQEEICQLVLHHDDHLSPKLKTIYKYRIQNKWSAKMMEDLLKVQYGDIMAHSKMGKNRLREWWAFKDYYDGVVMTHPTSLKDLDLAGKDVIEALNLHGKEVGKALDLAMEQAFYHPEKNKKALLLDYLKTKLPEIRKQEK